MSWNAAFFGVRMQIETITFSVDVEMILSSAAVSGLTNWLGVKEVMSPLPGNTV